MTWKYSESLRPAWDRLKTRLPWPPGKVSGHDFLLWREGYFDGHN